MDVRIYPSRLSGRTEGFAPKGAALRAMLAASLSGGETSLKFNNRSAEIFAAKEILSATFAEVTRNGSVYTVRPKSEFAENADISVGSGAAALRFLLPPITAAFKRVDLTGDNGAFRRVVKDLTESLKGVILTGERLPAVLTGKLKGGIYDLGDEIQPTFIDGLIFALAMTADGGELRLTEKAALSKHVAACVKLLCECGGKAEINGSVVKTEGGIFDFGGAAETGKRFSFPKEFEIKGEEQSAAPFFAAKALGGDITVENLAEKEGGTDVYETLCRCIEGGTVSFKGMTAVAPFAAVCAAYGKVGTETVLTKAFAKGKDGEREKAFVSNVIKMGGKAETTEDGYKIIGTGGLVGGVYTDGFGDPRIAAATAIAALNAKKPTVLLSAEAANKEYPEFFNELIRLGARIESL